MPEYFTKLIRQYEDAILRAWMEEMYRDRRVQLPDMLSYGQLVNHFPELLEELARALDANSSDAEIIEITQRMRSHAQVRFQQGGLIDEVARELMIFRQVFNDFLWREGIRATEGDLWELRDALRRADRLIDEMIAQMIVVYAASLRPPVETRTTNWPPPRRRRTDFPEKA
jgi:hypothetical protein